MTKLYSKSKECAVGNPGGGKQYNFKNNVCEVDDAHAAEICEIGGGEMFSSDPKTLGLKAGKSKPAGGEKPKGSSKPKGTKKDKEETKKISKTEGKK